MKQGRDIKSNSGFQLSSAIWLGALFVWILSEYLVMRLQIDRRLFGVGSIEFYYRPLMLALPLAMGFGTFRRLGKIIRLKGEDELERLSRGFGNVMLVSYLTFLATFLRLC
jgi:hypothetical protein